MSGTYLLIGDSQAVGLEDELREEMAARGWRQAGVFARVGISTARTALEMGHLPAADMAIVVLGGNDTAGAPLERAIRSLVSQIRARTIVWIGPAAVGSGHPDIAARKAAVQALQQRVVPSTGARWVNGHAMTLDLQHTPDQLHFVQSAQAVWARRIAALDFDGATGWRAGVVAALAVVGGAAVGFGAYALTRSLR